MLKEGYDIQDGCWTWYCHSVSSRVCALLQILIFTVGLCGDTVCMFNNCIPLLQSNAPLEIS